MFIKSKDPVFKIGGSAAGAQDCNGFIYTDIYLIYKFCIYGQGLIGDKHVTPIWQIDT